MQIIEMFYSLDGEGKRSGLPAVFIRKLRCNLLCTYCDTSYCNDPKKATDLSPEEIVSMVEKKFPSKRITFTGGEP